MGRELGVVDRRILSEFQFKALIQKQWEEARERKVFNYDLKCMYKLLEGEYNLSVQVGVD